MINAFYQEDIIERLGAIFTYGLNKKYSYTSIEEHIVSSSFVNDLENNKYDPESKIELIVEQTFNIKLNEEIDISFIGLFLAESYFKLFLYSYRSFEYVFLYWRLSNFINKYDIYHEMDFSNLRRDFDLERKKMTLLKKLSKTRHIKLNEISKLTGINENTIDKYSRNDKYLYSASFENIYKLSSLFNVKNNLFVSDIGVYLDVTTYLSDSVNDDYRNFIGLYFASFFDNRINEKDFKYLKGSKRFISSNGVRLIVLNEEINSFTHVVIEDIADTNTYIVIIPPLNNNNFSFINSFKDINAYEILIKSEEYVYLVKKGMKKEITETVNSSLLIKAKRAIKSI